MNLYILLFIIPIFISLYEYICYKFRSEKSLKILTFDGSNEAYHPSVVYDKKGLFYKPYYLAITPYPIISEIYRDRWECPSIYLSNNGLEWFTLPEIKNPIDDLSENEISENSHFSDVHLLINYDKGELECWYRFNNRSKNNKCEKIFKKVSKDGITWGERQLIIDVTNEMNKNIFGDTIVSPSIIYENEKYYIWYVNKDKYHNKRKIIRVVMKENNIILKIEQCVLLNKKCDPWHIDIQIINNIYYLLIYELSEQISIWQSKDGISFNFIKYILKRKSGSYYWNGLYRACLLADDKDFKIYFSCNDYKKSRIGVINSKNLESFNILDIPNGEYKEKYYEYIYYKYVHKNYIRILNLAHSVKVMVKS